MVKRLKAKVKARGTRVRGTRVRGMRMMEMTRIRKKRNDDRNCTRSWGVERVVLGERERRKPCGCAHASFLCADPLSLALSLH